MNESCKCNMDAKWCCVRVYNLSGKYSIVKCFAVICCVHLTTRGLFAYVRLLNIARNHGSAPRDLARIGVGKHIKYNPFNLNAFCVFLTYFSQSRITQAYICKTFYYRILNSNLLLLIMCERESEGRANLPCENETSFSELITLG